MQSALKEFRIFFKSLFNKYLIFSNLSVRGALLDMYWTAEEKDIENQELIFNIITVHLRLAAFDSSNCINFDGFGANFT